MSGPVAGPLGPVAGGVADDRHEPAEEAGHDDPAGPPRLGDRLVGGVVEDLDDRVRGEGPVHPGIGAGHGAAEQAGVDAGVSDGTGLGAGEGGGQQPPLVVEEGLAAEEQQLHRVEPDTGRDDLLGEPAQGGGRTGQHLGREVAQRRDRRLQRRAAADGQADVVHGRVGERVEDEEEAGVQLPGVEEVGDAVSRAQARVHEPLAEGGDEGAPLVAGVDGEFGGPGGAAGLVDRGLAERAGQHAAVVEGVGRPEFLLVDHRKVGEAVGVRRQGRVEVPVVGRVVAGETYEVRELQGGHGPLPR